MSRHDRLSPLQMGIPRQHNVRVDFAPLYKRSLQIQQRFV
jgi:hypothetical protein